MPTSLTQFLLHYSWRYRWPILGLFLIGLLWGVHASASPLSVKWIIDAIADHSDNLLYYVIPPLIVYLALEFFLAFLGTAYDYCILKAFPRLRSDIIDDLYQNLLNQTYPFFQDQMAGSLSNKISDLSKGSIAIISSMIDDFFSRSLLFLCGLATLFWVHPWFVFILAGWSLAFFMLSYHLSKNSEKYSREFAESRSTAIGKVVDGLSNIFNIKIFSHLHFERKYLGKYLGEMKQKEERMHAYMLKFKLGQNVLIVLLLAAMVSLLIYTRLKGWITVGDFSLVISLTGAIVNQTYYLAVQFVVLAEDIGECKQALLTLSKKPEAIEPPNAKPIHIQKGEIIFDHVFFEYEKEKPIFKDLNLKISPGEKVGIVGFSGSGKSTLAHLILRLYEVNSGRILIDGQNISKFSQFSIAHQIAMIPQDISLFHRTIYENILYGKLEASESEVLEAAEKAHCHSFMTQFTEGYRTLPGERGLKISGGQKQRIAIARAFLKNAPILILDEATSALDSVTEEQIQQSLESLMEGRTTLVIAHRLSTLSKMDRILVFEKGEIVEEGKHQELIERNGRYAQLWHLQTRESPILLSTAANEKGLGE